MGKIILAILILFAATSVSATWDVYGVDSVSPEQNNRHIDTRINFKIIANETATINQEFWMRNPDNTWEQLGTRSEKINKDEERDYIYKIGHEQFDQFGEYVFKFNDSTTGRSTQLTWEIPPKPSVTTSVSDPLYTNSDISHILFEGDIDDSTTGSFYDNKHLNDGEIVFYNITADQNGNIVQNKYRTYDLTLNEPTHAMKAIVPTDDFGQGNYEYVMKFNISSPPHDVTENYTIMRSGSFRVVSNYGKRVHANKWGDETAETIKQNISSEAVSIRSKIASEAEKTRINIVEGIEDIIIPDYSSKLSDIEDLLKELRNWQVYHDERPDESGVSAESKATGGFFSIIPFIGN